MARLNVKHLPLGFWMALLFNAVSPVACEDLFINPWQLRAPNQPYENLQANIGDTITFFWSADEIHTVYINPSGTCSDLDSILVGDSAPVTYTFTESDAVNTAAGSPVYFADNLDSLCEWGMRFTVAVNQPSNPIIDPTEAPTDVQTSPPTVQTSPPTDAPVVSPTDAPTSTPSGAPSPSPSTAPSTGAPTTSPTASASSAPSDSPTSSPSTSPTVTASASPTEPAPSASPSAQPSGVPSAAPSSAPSFAPSDSPSSSPSNPPSSNAPSSSPTITPTTPPVPFPTEPPTFRPTANPTANPTATPTAVPTPLPTNWPTRVPTEAPIPATKAPVEVGERVSETFVGLRMGLAGLEDFTPETQSEWEQLTTAYSTSFIFNDMKDSVTNFVTTYEVTDSAPYDDGASRRMMRGESRNLQVTQDVIIVEYTQTVQYNIIGTGDMVSAEDLVAAPFESEVERAEYVTVLRTASETALAGVKGVSKVQIPSQPTQAPAPTPGGGLSRTAIIGIACGGAGLLIVIILFIIYCRSGGGDGDDKEEPPLHVDVRNDEVSTLAGPDGPPTYGDRSVATVDYDYSKAYGGAGDTSVSSAGGTFGSQTQNISLPANAGATGAALGSIDDDSYSAQYDSPRSNLTGTNEEIIHIFAPPGKLGVVIDTPDDGAPVVHAVKDTSVIADRIIVGDKLVAVDDEDVRSMTAIKVSKMISRKGANPSRKLTIVRTVPIAE